MISDTNCIRCKWGKCHATFKNELDCFEHVRVDHIKRFNTMDCNWDFCNARTSTRWNLVNHMNTHLLIVRGTCYLCNKDYKWRGDWKKHLAKHSREEIEFQNLVSGLFGDNELELG